MMLGTGSKKRKRRMVKMQNKEIIVDKDDLVPVKTLALRYIVRVGPHPFTSPFARPHPLSSPCWYKDVRFETSHGEKRIQNLYLDNGIKPFRFSEGSLSALKVLRVRGGFVGVPHKSIEVLQNLKKLDIKGDCARVERTLDVPDEIGRLRKLKELVLNNIKMGPLPSSIGLLKNLSWISLQNTGMELFPEKLWDLSSSLRFLILSSNPIRSIP